MLLHEERAGPCLVPSNRTLHYRHTGIVTDPCSAPLYPAPHTRAQEHRCRAGAVCSAVVARCTISQVRPAQHTVILESLQRRAFYPRPRRPHAAPRPPPRADRYLHTTVLQVPAVT